ncbi:winged helix DNA-binding domain-containing protein [Streptosporangium sp. NPDC050855]|uniref:winged helix DNA-binding domain-containing protein n=1 Tax=Streptosporangium sp. NPDC050855 TaxID=3366194 RepID=UPI0037A31138
MKITWDGALAWRMNRQMLESPETDDPVAIVSRLCGVQAQVASSARTAVGVRQREPRRGSVDEALADRRLVKTWAMRGTLHLLPVEEATAYLSLLAATRSWEKASWQRTFVTGDRLEAIGEAARHALDGQVLTREELTAQVIDKTGDESIAEHLRSGWGAVLKPLAFQGVLCHGPSDGATVTFTRPDTYLPAWRGPMDPAEAAGIAIPAYLAAYGPAPIEGFDQWLYRGTLRKADLRAWVAALGDRITTVEIEGRTVHVRAEDLDDLGAARPTDTVRLLPAFDQYVLGPGTRETTVVPSSRRGEVSRAAGWISPVVVSRGRVCGTWAAEEDVLSVTVWKECDVPRKGLEAERDRLGVVLGRDLTLSVRTG